MRSRMTELWDRHGECDPTELESLTRVQDLTHSLGETLNGLAALHESLLRKVNDPDAVFLGLARPGTEERME